MVQSMIFLFASFGFVHETSVFGCVGVWAIVARHYILPRAQAQLLISTLRALSRSAAHLLNFIQENKEARTGPAASLETTKDIMHLHHADRHITCV